MGQPTGGMYSYIVPGHVVSLVVHGTLGGKLSVGCRCKDGSDRSRRRGDGVQFQLERNFFSLTKGGCTVAQIFTIVVFVLQLEIPFPVAEALRELLVAVEDLASNPFDPWLLERVGDRLDDGLRPV